MQTLFDMVVIVAAVREAAIQHWRVSKLIFTRVQQVRH